MNMVGTVLSSLQRKGTPYWKRDIEVCWNVINTAGLQQ